MRHLWYLAPDTVVFCLFDPETSDVEKREVARAIVCTPRPATIQLGKLYMPVLMPTNPSLASFVGTDSWKLWELLGVGHAWLQHLCTSGPDLITTMLLNNLFGV